MENARPDSEYRSSVVSRHAAEQRSHRRLGRDNSLIVLRDVQPSTDPQVTWRKAYRGRVVTLQAVTSVIEYRA